MSSIQIPQTKWHEAENAMKSLIDNMDKIKEFDTTIGQNVLVIQNNLFPNLSIETKLQNLTLNDMDDMMDEINFDNKNTNENDNTQTV